MNLQVLTRAVLAVAVVGAVAVLPAAAQDEAALAAAPRIPMAEFKALHASGKVLAIDTRAAESFAQGHIPGALNLPIAKMLEPDRLAQLQAETRPIVIYCA